MTISYNSNVPKEFQEELNENLRNIENEVGSFSMLAQSYEESFETQRLCIATLNNLVEQQQKEIEELKDSQTHYDAFGHNHVRLTAIEESSKVTVHEVQQLKSQINELNSHLLKTIELITIFGEAVDTRLKLIENNERTPM